MVGEVAEGVEDVGEGEVREVMGDIFGGDAEAPVFDDGADGGAGALDDGFAAEDGVIADDVGVFGGGDHGNSG